MPVIVALSPFDFDGSLPGHCLVQKKTFAWTVLGQPRSISGTVCEETSILVWRCDFHLDCTLLHWQLHLLFFLRIASADTSQTAQD